MSRSYQQSEELFLPASSHPRRDSFFDYPSSPTYLYDEESGTFKTVWPTKSKETQPREVLRETEWDDVRPPSPLRTPPRKQHYQPPDDRQREAKELGYFDGEAYPKEEPGYIYDMSHQQPPPGPTAAAVHLRSDHEIGRALSPPNRSRVALYDKPIDDYEDYDQGTGVDADGVSEASFSGQETRDDRLYLPSSRDPVSLPRLDTSKARLWATPRRDVGVEAPIVIVQPEEAVVQSTQDPSDQGDSGPYQRQRVFSDPGAGYGRVNPALGPGPDQNYLQEPDQYQQRSGRVPDPRRDNVRQVDMTTQEFYQREREQQHRQRVFSDPGAGSHWERRRDLAIGRSSMPSGGSFDDNSSSSFRVLNVQRVPVGSLEMHMSRPSKEDSKKLRVWKKLKGFVS